MRNIEPGTTATADLRVSESDLASVVSADPRDQYPRVFSTSRMVALMEIAASRILQPHLEGDELSVGVAVDILHTAATPPGALVTATARYTGQEGKLFVFEVSAADEGGEVGRGTHKRAVISTARLEAGAARRYAGT